MRTHPIVAGLCLFLVSLAAAAQPGPSAYFPLNPCRFFDSRVDQDCETVNCSDGSPFAAGSTHFLKVRESCNVPTEANAVAVTAVAYNAATRGHAKVWDSGILQPAASSFNFRSGPGGDSSFLVPRLCYPTEECSGVDLAIFVSQETHFILDVVGYAVLLPSE